MAKKNFLNIVLACTLSVTMAIVPLSASADSIVTSESSAVAKVDSTSNSGVSMMQTAASDDAHTHAWVKRTEQQWIDPVQVVVQEAYDEPVYGYVSHVYCNLCGALIDNDPMHEEKHLTADGDVVDDYGTTTKKSYEVTGYTHHDAVTETQVRGHWETVTGWFCSICGERGFDDVAYDDPNCWYANGVTYCADAGALSGYAAKVGSTANVFGVGDTMTRAQLAVVMWRLACPDEAAAYDEAATAAAKGVTSANGVVVNGIVDGQYYTAAANWAVENSVVNGFLNADGSRDFMPEGKVTFEQLVSVIVNAWAAKDTGFGTDALGAFADGGDVSDWAQKTMSLAAMSGLVSGYDIDGARYLRSGEDVARGRAACVLASALTYIDSAQNTYDYAVATQANAQTAYDSAKQAYDNAVAAAEAAKAAYATGSQGFFASNGSALAANYVANPETYSGVPNTNTNAGADGDATSFDNVYWALDIIEKVNQIRTSEGLSELRVTDSLMAIGEVQANYCTTSFNHMVYSSDFLGWIKESGGRSMTAENVAWGSSNPTSLWYNDEKQQFDEACMSLYGRTVAPKDAVSFYRSNYSELSNYASEHDYEYGHFLAIANPGYQYVGSGFATSMYTASLELEFNNFNKSDKTYTVAEYRTQLQNYIGSKDAAAANLEVATAAYERAAADLDAAKKATAAAAAWL